MSSACRSSVTSYLDVLTETNPKRPKILFKMHPSLERAAGIMREYMDDMIVNQQKWADNIDWWVKVSLTFVYLLNIVRELLITIYCTKGREDKLPLGNNIPTCIILLESAYC